MSRLIAVPDEIYEKAAALAEKQSVNVDELIAKTLTGLIEVTEFAERRKAGGTREGFLRALELVPDVEPEECDRLDPSISG